MRTLLGSVVLLALVTAVVHAGDAKSAFAVFGRGAGHAWRGAVPGLDRPAARLELEGKGGALSWDAVSGAEHYLVYFFQKAPEVAKGSEEKFWTGDQDGFVVGVQVEPRREAKRFTVVDANPVRGWSHAYVFVVENKERRALAATWKEGEKDAGPDGTTLPVRYRTPGGGR